MSTTSLPTNTSSKHIMTGPIKLQGTFIAEYTEKLYDKPGTYEWTVPEGVTSVTVAGCGGGAGGLTIACYKHTEHKLSGTVQDAESSSFGDFVIAGAKGSNGFEYVVKTGTFGHANNGEANQGAAAEPNGQVGESWMGMTRDFDFYGPGWQASMTKKAITVNSTNQGKYYGQGGNTHHFYDSDGYTGHVGIAGNSGAWDTKTITVTPGQKITIKVGAGSKGVMNEDDSDTWRYSVGNGTGGYIMIAYGQK